MPEFSASRNGDSRLLMRSVLRVAADGPEPLAAALAAGADALVVDMTGPAERRQTAAGFLRDRRRNDSLPRIFAEVSPDDARIDADLDAAIPGADGILISGTAGGGAIALIGARIAAREAIAGLPDGATAIVGVVTTGAGITRLYEVPGASRRLIALGWDADALAADLGAASARDVSGGLIEPLRSARTLCLAAAAAAAVAAIDTACPATAEGAAVRAEAIAARQIGFAGKFAGRAEHAGVLNEVFTGARPGSTRS